MRKFIYFSLVLSLFSNLILAQNLEPVIENGFQFEIKEIIKVGKVVDFNLKVTNLEDDDRMLGTAYYNVYFYDNNGTFYSANDLCLINDCDYDEATIKNIHDKAYTRSKGKIPSKIPINLNFRVNNLKNSAKHFVKCVIQCVTYYEDAPKDKLQFEVVFENIEFPSEFDENNPNRIIFGNQSIQFVEAQLVNDTLKTKFNHSNGSEEIYDLNLKTTKAYFNGEVKESTQFNKSISSPFNIKDIEVLPQRYNSFTSHIDNIVGKPTKIDRLVLIYNRYEFIWENLPVEIKVESQISKVYLSLDELEGKINENENITGKKIILNNIYFDSGSSQLLNTSFPQLETIVDILSNNINLNIEISGHTDNIGDNIPNFLLSQKRADAIKYYLIEKGIDPERIISMGKGMNEPIEDNSSDNSRSKNRRVEMKIVE